MVRVWVKWLLVMALMPSRQDAERMIHEELEVMAEEARPGEPIDRLELTERLTDRTVDMCARRRAKVRLWFGL
jgi:hypothetical protein